MFNKRNILITGGSGSWGNELTKQLLNRYNPEKIIIYSRSELPQVEMERRFKANPKLKFIIGDIRDLNGLNETMTDVDYVFHLAALKHVPICENNPWESIATNIIGTENVIRAAIKSKVKLVIDVSTDKACAPINLYGTCKSSGEKLIIHANKRGNGTKFVCIRAGNVMGTRGSVIPFFKELIKSGEDIPITDFNMTRYFMTLEEAIGLLFKAVKHCYGGEIFVMKMPACKIVDLAEVMIKELNSKSKLKEIGIRPGEKLHEFLISEYEAKNTLIFDDTYYVILPQLNVNNLIEKYKNFEKFKVDKYSSNDKLMSKEEIKKKLKDGHFI
ncbi:UDP-N-acetylglucosamine 4,6-dehydratase (inverting) [groundwater metagenome]|uniref:UDP-N-acetylglucosamine 4,6-dehydratase (Inverting) n=1 Tax=groundwater metagenome TaxID=717931 RepID=A0A098EFI9_9ZZZZ